MIGQSSTNQKGLVIAIVLFLLLLSASWSFAGGMLTVTYYDSITLENTNWKHNLIFPKFNPDWGWLEQVKVSLDGHVEGALKYENTSLTAIDPQIDMTLSAVLEVYRPGSPPGTLIVDAQPLTSTVDINVPKFDGTLDFGGTSGKTYSGLSADESDFATLTTQADLNLFTGTGDITLPTWASGESTGHSQSGNSTFQFITNASAEGWVEYQYEQIPEPGTIALMTLGLVGLAGWKRRRRQPDYACPNQLRLKRSPRGGRVF